MTQSQLLRDVLPDFYAQVLTALRDEGYSELAAQLPSVIIEKVPMHGRVRMRQFHVRIDGARGPGQGHDLGSRRQR